MSDILITVHHEDDAGNIITLLDNLTVIYDYRVITVPEGFKSDGFSTPRFLWSTISPAIDQRTLRGPQSAMIIFIVYNLLAGHGKTQTLCCTSSAGKTDLAGGQHRKHITD